ncbi:MAG: putative zinc-binding protein [Methanosarcina thermophila]|uniref:putative zinc-binding protein n=1 Tax=Methanosarcina thermophila TaxID=2210 RepID=UPI00216845F8|nr:putative zinc-binding protein [Methanosarcina thermophila]HOA69616.1 putative zinc-binding protein [Methanosarcina thermophila]HOQ65808.1 putative zinc-binding protein [Methanosarcina thermophila]HPT80015.1 putative zinc-binding protein [Methanosarcina thermophila]HPZ20724.1 putative zinc-binding protein [Methanosarcina thermophila]HQD95007.1 putative zinc-binding protein [Methanosarcina thermophila]
MFFGAAAAHKGVDAVENAAVSYGFKTFALNGCTDRCDTKKLDEDGMKADVYLMVTELGIEKATPSITAGKTLIISVYEN